MRVIVHFAVIRILVVHSNLSNRRGNHTPPEFIELADVLQKSEEDRGLGFHLADDACLNIDFFSNPLFALLADDNVTALGIYLFGRVHAAEPFSAEQAPISINLY